MQLLNSLKILVLPGQLRFLVRLHSTGRRGVQKNSSSLLAVVFVLKFATFLFYLSFVRPAAKRKLCVKSTNALWRTNRRLPIRLFFLKKNNNVEMLFYDVLIKYKRTIRFEFAKRFWRRYIYLWLKYALFEELTTKDFARARQVYKTAVEVCLECCCCCCCCCCCFFLRLLFDSRYDKDCAAQEVLVCKALDYVCSIRGKRGFFSNSLYYF